jgi:hypothetical protein
MQFDRTSKKVGIMPACAALAIAALTLGGCSTYRVPGMAADFHALGITPDQVNQSTDVSITRKLDRKPLAGFPTNIAVVRVQGSEYRSYTSRGYGEGRFTVVTTRDVEPQEAFDKLSAQPMVAGVASLNSLVLPPRINNEEDLRGAAASVQADMLLLYTFDTKFETDKERFIPLALISLGLFPDRTAHVTSTAAAALIDTRNGYVYGVAEATAEQHQLANAWSNEQAIDRSRQKAEKEAFVKLVDKTVDLWRNVATRYGPSNGAGAMSALNK